MVVRKVLGLVMVVGVLVCVGPVPAVLAEQPVGVAEGLRQYGPFVELVLDNGDRVKGIYSETVDGRAQIEHPVLGAISVPVYRITEVRPVGNVTSAPPVVEEVPAEEPAAEAADEPAEDAAADGDRKGSFLKRMKDDGWEGELLLGINGSEGNTENFSFLGVGAIEREDDHRRISAAASYVLKESDGEETDNRFNAKARHDWLFPGSRWEWFLAGEVVVDQFKDYDWRWSATTGPGYRFIDNDDTFLIGRAGLGVSQEIGAEDDDLIPEAFVGYEFTHDLNDRWSLATSGELYPSLDDGGEFRSAVRAGVEYKLSMDSDWRLKAGVEHRHESDVDPGTEKDDLDYFISLVLGF